MKPTVTNAEKRSFVEWFLKHYELKKRECAWLLTYLMSDYRLLNKLRFVDEMPAKKRTLLMSSKCSKHIPFQFMKGKFSSTDVETAFHDILLNDQEEISVLLHFSQSEQCPQYAAVREVGSVEKDKLKTNSLYSLIAEMFLDEVVEKFEKERLYKLIDQSLARQDKQMFLRLSRRLKEMEAEDEMEA
jgi:uncharacterized protein YpiB (UPF0302 family)